MLDMARITQGAVASAQSQNWARQDFSVFRANVLKRSAQQNREFPAFHTTRQRPAPVNAVAA